MSYITSIGTAIPSHQLQQSALAEFMVRAMNLNTGDARKLHALYRATGIATRNSVLPDYGCDAGFELFSGADAASPFPSTKQRLALFKRYAPELSLSAIRQCMSKIPLLAPSEITHLVVVSCTGMYAPGLDIDIVKALGLRTSVQRTCINFMGCYAAFNALKLADSFCAGEQNSKVLIVCTELCSLHFQRDNTEDNLLANALFADGSAALIVEGGPRSGINLRPLAFHCDLAAQSEQEMAWTVGDLGFEMKLSTYVPDIIRSGISRLTKSLLQRPELGQAEIAYFAVHPGGKKILEVIAEELKIEAEQNRFAYDVLRNNGNMSSPTVLFVLNEIAKTLHQRDDGKAILSFAFGPGLTMESMLLQIENH